MSAWAPSPRAARVAKPLVDAARRHESRTLRAPGAAGKAAVRKLLGKIARHA